MGRDNNKKKGPKRSKQPPRAPVDPEIRKDDIYEAEDSDPDEFKDAVGRRYDNVESYEYELPEDFEDEEIEEDEAFNSEDERMYGHLFEDDEDEGAGGGWTDDDDDDDEDEDDSEMPPTDLLDSDEEDINAIFQKTKDGSDTSSSSEDEDSEDDSDASSDHEQEEDEEDDDDDDEEGEQRRQDLIESVTGRAQKQAKRLKHKQQVRTEAYPESEYNLPGSIDGNQLTLADLISGLGEGSTKLGPARKTLERLEKKAAPISAPLPGPIRQRQERKAGYESAKKEATKWVPMVKAHREAPTLVFTSDKSGVPKVASTTAALAANHKPETDMEAEIAAILEAAGAGTAQAVTEAEEALALNTLTAEEAAERRNKLAKMRALLFYHELKAKRMKKIKSKEYRRKIKKAEKRKALGFGGESGDADFDEETLRHEMEDAEFDRAKERLTLKHKNTSRWAKHALQRGALADEATRQALNEQLRLGIELRSRVDRLARPRGEGSDDDDGSTSASEDGGFGSSDDDSSSDDDGGGGEGRESRHARKLRAAATNVLQGDEEEQLPEKGLLALPFMKRAMDKRKKEAQAEAQEILDTLDHGANGTGGTGTAKDTAKGTGGRMSFGGPKSQSDADKLAQRVQRLEEEGSDMDSDDNEDAEAKAQRLSRQLAAGEGRVLATGTGTVLRAAPDQQPIKKKHNNNNNNSSSDGPQLTTETNGPVTISGIKRKSVEESGHLFAAAANGTNNKQMIAKGQGVSIGPSGAGTNGNANDDTEVVLPSFIAVPSFQGAKAGYVYQKGSKGIGYYRDKLQSGSDMKKKKKNDNNTGTNNKKSKGLTQEELVKRAFAGDDVVADFAAVKAAEIDQQLPKVAIPAVLPGWGSWSANQKKEPAWLTAAKHKAEARKKAAVASRKDAKLKDVIISEKWDKKASAFKTASVPFPFDNRDTYERAMRQPLGRDFNSDASFRDLTRPAVIKDAGVIIEPARYSQAAADHSVKESKARVKPAVKVIAGGISKRSKKAKG